jgi:hypothetical protein
MPKTLNNQLKPADIKLICYNGNKWFHLAKVIWIYWLYVEISLLNQLQLCCLALENLPTVVVLPQGISVTD